MKKPRHAIVEVSTDPLFLRVREALHYDASTGKFRWLIDIGPRYVGDPAGSITSKGKGARKEVQVGLDGVKYPGHRLAWFWITGKWPKRIDHINCDPLDNRLANLRTASAKVNAQNRRTAAKNSKTGFLGVRLHKGRFRAYITVTTRRDLNLGTFDTPEEAHAAYVAAKRIYHKGCTL